MDEMLELRVVERHAARMFDAGEGVRLGKTVRKVLLRSDDPRLPRIAELQATLSRNRTPFFFGWQSHRRYTQQELDRADWFYAFPARVFEPEGEARGTIYEDLGACKNCGAGAPRVGPLILNGKRMPSGVDFAATIADELVVSGRLANAFRQNRVTGIELRVVYSAGTPLIASSTWSEPVVAARNVEIVPPTVVADEPFASPGPACPSGDLLGLNLISELHVERVPSRRYRHDPSVRGRSAGSPPSKAIAARVTEDATAHRLPQAEGVQVGSSAPHKLTTRISGLWAATVPRRPRYDGNTSRLERVVIFCFLSAAGKDCGFTILGHGNLRCSARG